MMNDPQFKHIRQIDNEVIADRLASGLLRRGRPEGMLANLISSSRDQGLLFTYPPDERSDVLGYLASSECDGWLHVDEIAVHKSFRRRGIGSLLIVAAKNEVKLRYLKGMTIITDRIVPENIDFFSFLEFEPISKTEHNRPNHIYLLLEAESEYFSDISRRIAMRCVPKLN